MGNHRQTYIWFSVTSRSRCCMDRNSEIVCKIRRNIHYGNLKEDKNNMVTWQIEQSKSEAFYVQGLWLQRLGMNSRFRMRRIKQPVVQPLPTDAMLAQVNYQQILPIWLCTLTSLGGGSYWEGKVLCSQTKYKTPARRECRRNCLDLSPTHYNQ